MHARAYSLRIKRRVSSNLNVYFFFIKTKRNQELIIKLFKKRAINDIVNLIKNPIAAKNRHHHPGKISRQRLYIFKRSVPSFVIIFIRDSNNFSIPKTITDECAQF